MTVVQILLLSLSGIAIGLFISNLNRYDYSTIRKINQEDFTKNMRKGQLIDVRKEEDYKQDKIKGARHFRMNQLTDKTGKLRKDLSVYVYCNNGKRSKKAARKLIRKGYTNIYILEGGFNNYQK